MRELGEPNIDFPLIIELLDLKGYCRRYDGQFFSINTCIRVKGLGLSFMKKNSYSIKNINTYLRNLSTLTIQVTVQTVKQNIPNAGLFMLNLCRERRRRGRSFKAMLTQMMKLSKI